MLDADLAYIAGIFDGEGCINFAKARNTHFIRILVVNTNRDLLEFLQEGFGGSVGRMSRKDGWKQAWQWRLSWSRAIDFLEAISPWLRVKAEQADVAFAWAAIRPGRGQKVSESAEFYHNALPLLREQLTFLNSRGSKDRGEDPISRTLRETEYAA